MPLGLGSEVVAPMAHATPSWLHALMDHGVSLWNSHPVSLAVGVAWLQVGLGLALIASRGRLGRAAGAVAAAWAALVWLVGNGAGGMFVRGSSLLFGWPGASLFYCAAGVWIALSRPAFERYFSLLTTRALAILLGLGALLQCLPSAQFWHGGNTNALTAMTTYMTSIAQPHWLAAVVRQAGVVAGTMGGGFNVAVILWLVLTALGLWLAPARAWRWPTRSLVAGCLVFWVVAQDTALFGGLATDVNSLVPLGALAWCAAPRRRERSTAERRLPVEMTASAAGVVATFASAMVLVALASMAFATVSSAETTLYAAQNGSVNAVNAPAPRFTLTDQFGRPYHLGEHPGRVTILTFLDPRCYTDCPLLANQLASLRADLGASARVDVVAVAANPFHETRRDVRHFIAQHHLGGVRDFYFVTGARSATSAVWRAYGVSVVMRPSDTMSVHSDVVYLISGDGRLRWIVPDDPIANAPGAASAVSEIRHLLATMGVR
jgi:cytochrome oxidase Cu insertion factor (SCO1/SenC/PrrC family)